MDNENLQQPTEFNREEILRQIDELDQKIKNSQFIDPVDMRKRDELYSLLWSGGVSTEIRLKPGKPKKPHRVTPFNRTRS